MKKIFLILFLSFFSIQFACPFRIYSQSTWQRLYDDPLHKTEYGTGFAFANTDSSSFYVAGNTYAPVAPFLIKIGITSDTFWSKTLSPYYEEIYGACKGFDNSCIMVGNGLDFYKIDSAGNFVWRKSYGGNYARLFDIKPVSNNKYIACGENNIDSSGHIMLIDTLGNLIWQRDYSSNNKKLFFSINEIPQKGFIASGITRFLDTSRIELIYIDYDGNIYWEKNYKIANNYVDANKVVYKDGFIFLGGNYTQFDTLNNPTMNMFLATVDTNGNMITYKLIPNLKNEETFGSMSLINTNKFVFTSYNFTSPDDSNYTRILILDTSGTIKREKYVWSIPGGDNIIRCIQPLSNGNILFTGDANYRINYPIGQGPIDIWVIMADSLLNFPDSLIGIRKINSEMPTQYKLYQNYPNPFNPTTKIRFSIPFKKGDVFVKLVIYDVLGREVKKLVNEQLKPGIYEINWNGSKFASGLYFCRLITDNFIETKKLILLK